MCHVGAETIPEFQEKARLMRITSAGLLREPRPRRCDYAREPKLSSDRNVRTLWWAPPLPALATRRALCGEQ